MSGNDHVLPPDSGFYSHLASLPGITVDNSKSDNDTSNNSDSRKK